MSIIASLTKKIEETAIVSPTLRFFCKLYYNPIVKREIELANITKKDHVLCIGGGPFPWTAIEIARDTRAKVTVIDVHYLSTLYAKQAISIFGLENLIEIRLGDGQSIDTSDFTVTHIALQAMPQDRILSNVLNRSKQGSRVLVRCAHDCLGSFYSCLSNQCLCDMCKSTRQKNSTMSETLLFIKGLRGERFEEANAYASRVNINSTASVAK
ncbi:hypothetical protein [Desulfuribacillus alkaliarsenatis]|uniref:Methyltransferase domain-containing protein n=1 Tax=Desulfuribacillus alkaliarsenatis TaxID=766136 RepID=A0A1E5G3V5_9FIRM|nr:hypothetical protein [Desulfuribacillus alkaliarsenatis]OEF97763.1 hypothetical protein BHF68_13820 [Desulfuribacillus alkaliarsenatis]